MTNFSEYWLVGVLLLATVALLGVGVAKRERFIMLLAGIVMLFLGVYILAFWFGTAAADSGAVVMQGFGMVIAPLGGVLTVWAIMFCKWGMEEEGETETVTVEGAAARGGIRIPDSGGGSRVGEERGETEKRESVSFVRRRKKRDDELDSYEDAYDAYGRNRDRRLAEGKERMKGRRDWP